MRKHLLLAEACSFFFFHQTHLITVIDGFKAQTWVCAHAPECTQKWLASNAQTHFIISCHTSWPTTCGKPGMAHIRVSDAVSPFQTHVLFRLTQAHLSCSPPWIKCSLDKQCLHLLEFMVALVVRYSRLAIGHPGRFQVISIIEGLGAASSEIYLPGKKWRLQESFVQIKGCSLLSPAEDCSCPGSAPRNNRITAARLPLLHFPLSSYSLQSLFLLWSFSTRLSPIHLPSLATGSQSLIIITLTSTESALLFFFTTRLHEHTLSHLCTTKLPLSIP